MFFSEKDIGFSLGALRKTVHFIVFSLFFIDILMCRVYRKTGYRFFRLSISRISLHFRWIELDLEKSLFEFLKKRTFFSIFLISFSVNPPARPKMWVRIFLTFLKI